MHAYPQMNDFAFRNVQKCYAVTIIDNACEPKYASVAPSPNVARFALSLTATEKIANLWGFLNFI